MPGLLDDHEENGPDAEGQARKLAELLWMEPGERKMLVRVANTDIDGMRGGLTETRDGGDCVLLTLGGVEHRMGIRDAIGVSIALDKAINALLMKMNRVGGNDDRRDL